MSSEKVEILKLEYQLLTNEINSRVKFRFALLSLIIALIGFLVNLVIEPPEGAYLSEKAIFSTVLISAMLFAAVWARMGQLIYHCALHLKQVETRINECSNPGGDPLLTWYSKEFPKTWLMQFYGKFSNRSGT